MSAYSCIIVIPEDPRFKFGWGVFLVVKWDDCILVLASKLEVVDTLDELLDSSFLIIKHC
jgi:hypothetical protein